MKTTISQTIEMFREEVKGIPPVKKYYYKVYAETKSYPYVIVEASNEAKALEIARNTDAEDFVFDGDIHWKINPPEMPLEKIEESN